MKKEKKNTGKFCLKWPWSLIVYIVLLLLLRAFAIPVILLLMAWNKKQQPNGPEEGYCLQRTRRRLARLVWAVLFLLIGLACGFVFVLEITGDRSGWEIVDYVTVIIAGVIGLSGILGGLYEAFTDVRDAFFPGKSRLARSIRSQLPYPEAAPGVKELFAMVDEDIRENGQWFDRVAVGKEWVLGDEASAISRIRVVCGRNEVCRRHYGGRVQTSRIIELYLMDDRRQVQATGLRDGRELEALLGCLRLRAPEALFCSYKEYMNYCSKSEEEWQTLEREFGHRRALRELQMQEQERAAVQSNPDFTLIDLQGQRTSRFSRETIRKLLQTMAVYGQHFVLEPVEPVAAGSLGLLMRMECGISDRGLMLLAVLRQPDNQVLVRALPLEEEAAWNVLTGLLEERCLPDLSCWQAFQKAPGQMQPDKTQLKLTLTDRTGATRDYTSFTHRDVELAGEGLAGGKYTVVFLLVGARYIYLRAGTKDDGRVTVNASRPDPDRLRVFETKCSDRQAQIWLLELADGEFAPDFSLWKDITGRLQKQSEQKKK